MQFNLSIQPAQLELIVRPGTTLTQAYEVTNNSDNNLFLTTSVDPWIPQGPDGSIDYSSASKNPHLTFSLANSDLKLNQTFILRPHLSRQLVLKIKSDADILPGDSYYTFFLSQDATGTLNPDFNQSRAFARIGSHILLSSSGSESPEVSLQISQFSLLPRFRDIFFTPLRFSGTITNNSPYYTRPEGKIVLTKDNLTVKELILDPQNVLAHHSRTIQCQDSCTISPPFWPGRYTATLQTSSTSASISFFVLPLSPLLALGLILLILALLHRKR